MIPTWIVLFATVAALFAAKMPTTQGNPIVYTTEYRTLISAFVFYLMLSVFFDRIGWEISGHFFQWAAIIIAVGGPMLRLFARTKQMV